jgi:hypothetical protein
MIGGRPVRVAGVFEAAERAARCNGEELMTAKLWLRIASVLALLLALGHTLGGRKHWSPMGPNTVLDQMTVVHFEVMGVSRSYLDFYTGFGFSLSVLQALLGILLWQLSGAVATAGPQLKPMIGVIALAAIANSIIAACFLFVIPAVSLALVAIAVVIAFLRVR